MSATIFRIRDGNGNIQFRIEYQEQPERRPIEYGWALRFGPHWFRFVRDGLEHMLPPVGVRISKLRVERQKKRGTRRVLNDLTFCVKPGSLTGILGPSGCGKSTLLKRLLKQVPKVAGEIYPIPPGARSGGDEMDGIAIAYVPQEDLVYPFLTVEENLVWAVMLRDPDLTPEKAMERVSEVLAITDLKNRSGDLVGVAGDDGDPSDNGHLSGGERKRLSVAIELLANPQLLLLDEPTSGLDPRVQDAMMDWLKQLPNRGTTVLCVTHSLETLKSYDQIVLLRTLHGPQSEQNSLVYEGHPQNLLSTLDLQDMTEAFGKDVDALPPCHDSGTDVDVDSADNTSSRYSRSLGVDQHNNSTDSLGWSRIWGVAMHTWRSLTRNRLHSMMVFALPAILGAMIFFSQSRSKSAAACPETLPTSVFLVVSAIWLGMTLAVREIVSERGLCERDIRAGLKPLELLLGKMLYVTGVSGMQALLLAGGFLILGLSGLFNLEIAAGFLKWTSVLPLLWSIWLAAICGALAGLAVSSMSKSEALAITLLPLLLLPHLLFNRSICGEGIIDDKDAAYAPISCVAWRHPNGASASPAPGGSERFYKGDTDYSRVFHIIGSVGLVSRPAINVIELGMCNDNSNPIGKATVVSEWIYLVVITAVHMLILLFLFLLLGPGNTNLIRKFLIWIRKHQKPERALP